MNPEASFNATQLLFIYGGLQSLVLGSASFFWKKENRSAHRLFAGIMVLMALFLLASAGRREPPTLTTAPYWFIHLWGALILLLGPLIYFYVRTSVDAGYLFKGPRFLHGIPALIHLSLLIPVILVGSELRPAFIETYLNQELYRSFIPGIRVGFVSAFIYAIASFVWIYRFEKHALDVASFSDEASIRWLKWFTGLFVVFFFSMRLSTQEPFYQLSAVLSALFISAVTFSALVRPDMLYGVQTVLKLPDTSSADEKYVTSTLSPDQKRTYLENLLSYIEDEKPYLRHNLTLKDIATHTRIPDRYLSQIVNEELGKHFRDFINGYRVNHARSLLLDPSQAHLSIDGVAEEAGFKSRSAFYEAFKRSVGMTPGAFRASPPSSKTSPQLDRGFPKASS